MSTFPCGAMHQPRYAPSSQPLGDSLSKFLHRLLMTSPLLLLRMWITSASLSNTLYMIVLLSHTLVYHKVVNALAYWDEVPLLALDRHHHNHCKLTSSWYRMQNVVTQSWIRLAIYTAVTLSVQWKASGPIIKSEVGGQWKQAIILYLLIGKKWA